MEKYLEDEKQTQEEFEADLERRVREAVAAQFLLDEIAKREEFGIDQQELSEHMGAAGPAVRPGPAGVREPHVRAQPRPRAGAGDPARQGLARLVESAVVKDASGNVVELKNLRPDGTIGEPVAEEDALPRSRRGAGRQRGLTDTPIAIECTTVHSMAIVRPCRRPAGPRGPTSLDAVAAVRGRRRAGGAQRATRTWPSWTASTGGLAGHRRPVDAGPAAPRDRPRGLAGSAPACARRRTGWIRRPPRVGPRLEATPRGRFVSSAVNGLIGDRLVQERPRLAIAMGVRHDGRDVALERDALATVFPHATERLVVFLHGPARPRATGTRPGGARHDVRRDASERAGPRSSCG